MRATLRRLHASDADDFFSPGSDLVLCILAMAVLMLILVGVSFRPEATNADGAARADAAAAKLTLDEQRRSLSDMTRRIDRLLGEKRELQSANDQQAARIRQLEATRPTQTSEPDRVILKPSSGRSPYQQNGYDLSEFGTSELINGLRSKREEFIHSEANTLLIEGFASAEPDRTTDTRPFWNLSAYRIVECNRDSIRETKDCREHYTFDRNLDLAFRRARRVWEHLVFLRGLPRWCATIITHGRNRSPLLESQVGRLAGETEIRNWDIRWPDNTDPSVRAPSPTPIPLDDPRLSAERKVEIRAISDPNSRCKPSDLASALRRL